MPAATTHNIEARLRDLGLSLPQLASPKGNYLPALSTGHLLYLSGALPLWEGELRYSGAVGAEQTLEAGYEAAKLCALNSLAVIKAELGSLDAIEQIVSVSGYVYGKPGFADSPQVINGASDLLVELLGDRGKHTRAAVTVAGLPLQASVEIQMVLAK